MSRAHDQINHIQSPLVPLHELKELIAEHLEHLVHAEQEFPEHHATIANLTHQFERHLTILVAAVEIYATLQQTILHDLRELIPTADAVAVHDPSAIPPSPFNLGPVPTSTSSSSRVGRFAFYAVRKGRTLGIFNNWADCYQSTNGVPNQFKGFHSRNDAQQYLNLPE
jgi:hypothetical protein